MAVNQFTHDTEAELNFLKSWCEENNHPCEIANVWLNGGAGAKELAERVVELVDQNNQTFTHLYNREDSLEDKILTIAKKVYGANGVVYTEEAQSQLDKIKSLGYENFLVCMAKTPVSLSDDPKVLGRPTDFNITIREVRISAGAGFIVCLTGNVLTMPGLPKQPAALKMDVTPEGECIGLF